MTKPYHVKIAPQAAIDIKLLPPKQIRLLVKFVEALAVNPRPPGAKKVEGMIGLYCEHIQHHRVIYKIEEQDVLILLVKDNHGA
ncbi:MAG: type II toxin-antitoxin system RelE/ParE family toxin [Gammaproteobacteria bacterium]|nr:type II toxin-antitoxin system RelE/ParE family toxin [Gammaproteobacteria bacterium]